MRPYADVAGAAPRNDKPGASVGLSVWKVEAAETACFCISSLAARRRHIRAAGSAGGQRPGNPGRRAGCQHLSSSEMRFGTILGRASEPQVPDDAAIVASATLGRGG